MKQRRRVRLVKAHRECVTNDTTVLEPSNGMVTPRCSSEGMDKFKKIEIAFEDQIGEMLVNRT
jgi:hypothetical protein